MATLLAGSSARNAMHLRQGTINFRQFDFGETENQKRYGSNLPPSYSIAKINVPTYMYYGGQDNYITPSIIDPLSKKFTKGTLRKVSLIEKFSHVDFIASMEAKERINDYVFEVIKSYEKQ